MLRIDVKKLLGLMYDNKMNNNALVEASGLSRATITSVKSGKSCSYETAAKIAGVFDLKPQDILEN